MFVLDIMSGVPIYEQIVNQFEEYVLTGILKAEEKLPSVRSLSMELSINPNTIQKAYTELDRRGLVKSVPGKGVFVSENACELITEVKKKKLDQFIELAKELCLAGMTVEELKQALAVLSGGGES